MFPVALLLRLAALSFAVQQCFALATIVMESSQEFPAVAQMIAESLHLPLLLTAPPMIQRDPMSQQQPDLYLSLEPYNYKGIFNDYCLSISQAVSQRKRKATTTTTATTTKPLTIDFWPPITSRLGQRRNDPSVDLLIKAIYPASTVIDATAGFGQDAWLIATNSGAVGGSTFSTRCAARVTMVERNPIVAALLRDALRRLSLVATHDPDSKAGDLLQRLSLVEMDALDYLSLATTSSSSSFFYDTNNRHNPPPDVVYLDPMFPTRRKSAAVKKNMQILHTLLATETKTSDTSHERRLLHTARQVARTKVVVKRPIHAEPMDGGLSSSSPSWTIAGSINRWDVYATRRSTME